MNEASDESFHVFTGLHQHEFVYLLDLLGIASHKLVLILLWMRLYLPDRCLAFMIGIAQSTCNNWLHESLELFFEKLQRNVQFATHEFRMKHGANYHGLAITVVIDGMLQLVQKPRDKGIALHYYSGKEKEYCVGKLIGVTADGYILTLTPSRRGSIPDHSQVCTPTVFRAFQTSLQHDEHVLGDNIFTGVIDLLAPQSVAVPRHKPNDSNEELRKLSKIRAIVENTIERLRNWAILKHTFRHSLQNEQQVLQTHQKICTVIAALHNLFGAASMRRINAKT